MGDTKRRWDDGIEDGTVSVDTNTFSWCGRKCGSADLGAGAQCSPLVLLQTLKLTLTLTLTLTLILTLTLTLTQTLTNPNPKP